METITAVMVTGKDPRRLRFAERAIVAFQLQTYPSKQLLIVSDSPTIKQLPEGPQIRHVYVDRPNQSLGALRNVGLANITSGYVLQWDDDDYYHPDYMSYMRTNAHPSQPALLLNQLRYSLVSRSGFKLRYDRAREGIPGAVLFARDSVQFPYQEIGKHEDSRFLNDNWGLARNVLDNPAHLYVRLYTGLNTWDEKHIMRHLAGRTDVNEIPPSDWREVAKAIGRY